MRGYEGRTWLWRARFGLQHSCLVHASDIFVNIRFNNDVL